MVSPADLETLFGRLEARDLRARDLGISYRQLNHWDTNGLLLQGADRAEGQSWRAFSLLDLFWIRLAQSLRNWGITLEVLRRLKDELEAHLPPPFDPEADPAATGPRVFLLVVAEFVITRVDLNLLVLREGEFLFYNPARQDGYDDATRRFFAQHHLSVSLAAIFHEVLHTHGLGHPLFRLPGFLSPAERDLIRAVKLGQLEFLKIFPLDQVAVEWAPVEPGEMERDLLRLLVGWPYERIAYRYAGGQTHEMAYVDWNARLPEAPAR